MFQDAIETLLGRRIGLDPAAIGRAALVSAVERRMTACRETRPESYVARLRGGDDEFDALIDEVVVRESWFLRDETPFSYLGQYAVSKWRMDHPGQTMRVLSIPCGTGEEAYSIAIAMLEAGFTPGDFSIEAIDISRVALAQAARAVYNAHSLRRTTPAFRERYFSRIGQGYRLNDERVARSVNFARGNLVAPEFKPDVQCAYDVIFCRNLLIYFDSAARQRAVTVLDRLLADDGLLFVGHAEMGTLLAPRFASVGFPRAFAFRKKSVLTAPVPGSAPRATPPLWKASPRAVQPERSGAQPAAHSAAPVAQLESGQPLPTLERTRLLADQGKLEEAVAACRLALQEEPCAEGYFLLGLIEQARGDQPRAQECFNKVLYLDPEHYEALICLALQREHAGDSSGAALLRRRIERLRENVRQP